MSRARGSYVQAAERFEVTMSHLTPYKMPLKT